jgi:diadenosine tetraphosphate (Ap4A) HIT family hydrolase
VGVFAMNSKSARSACALCLAVADTTRDQGTFLHNRRLLETERFVVLPSLGPLMPGHVMVVSKVHCHNLASMGEAGIREYESLAADLRIGPLLRGSDPLEAEHGSTGDDKAGACVIHTHVHWLPGMGRFLAELKRRLSPRAEVNILELGGKDGPYIFARAGEMQGIFQAERLPSQTIRRILCDLIERDDIDWRQALRPDWVEETVKAWQTEET